MNKKIVYSLWAVLSAILFSTSGLMVVWLSVSFTAPAQLVVRAIVALIISIGWVLVEDHGFNLAGFAKYNKKLLTLTLLLRPLFNFCFIMTITAENATVSLMILLFVRMLVNVLFTWLRTRTRPANWETMGYLLVTVGILVYGWGTEALWTLSLLWAVVSGALEAVRLELIQKLEIADRETAKFSVIEFAGMLIVSLLFLWVSGSGIWKDDPVVSLKSWYGIFLAISAVVILKLDYYVAPKVKTGVYSAILASEIGFAGLINYLFLGTVMGLPQILGILISVAAIVLVGFVQKK